jgi:hypothetical protein
MRVRSLILAIVSMGLGCDGGPELSTCFQGAFFADCGGDSGPRYACTTKDCRWFVGGNIASGYSSSTCPVDDICCHDGEPFKDGSGGVGGNNLVCLEMIEVFRVT